LQYNNSQLHNCSKVTAWRKKRDNNGGVDAVIRLVPRGSIDVMNARLGREVIRQARWR